MYCQKSSFSFPSRRGRTSLVRVTSMCVSYPPMFFVCRPDGIRVRASGCPRPQHAQPRHEATRPPQARDRPQGGQRRGHPPKVQSSGKHIEVWHRVVFICPLICCCCCCCCEGADVGSTCALAFIPSISALSPALLCGVSLGAVASFFPLLLAERQTYPSATCGRVLATCFFADVLPYVHLCLPFHRVVCAPPPRLHCHAPSRGSTA